MTDQFCLFSLFLFNLSRSFLQKKKKKKKKILFWVKASRVFFYNIRYDSFTPYFFIKSHSFMHKSKVFLKFFDLEILRILSILCWFVQWVFVYAWYIHVSPALIWKFLKLGFMCWWESTSIKGSITCSS